MLPEGLQGGAVRGIREGRARRRRLARGLLTKLTRIQSAQTGYIQWVRFFNPASTTPFGVVGSATEIVGVEAASGSPEPELEPRPGGFMATEACRGAAHQFGSGVSRSGRQANSSRFRCDGSCETFEVGAASSKGGNSVVQTRVAKSCNCNLCHSQFTQRIEMAAWLAPGRLGEILRRPRIPNELLKTFTAREIAHSNSSVAPLNPCSGP